MILGKASTSSVARTQNWVRVMLANEAVFRRATVSLIIPIPRSCRLLILLFKGNVIYQAAVLVEEVH
ncbi:hypothetical protein KZX46_01395 (plasmid) [Polymorphobacter sp. PAMC 29334]|uniref:hypothetical protein n=1 Tax=Polymorphobacter sp. PAMC 29334 TaxID=2862331 RepID=UPI001C77F8F2|nr:hypothetical protein [Polymorphobacter sp. PAMC 29334]QYE33462.1 hypothetical protein KZX46_01395 [Polymorphobacter sp. PAMC 29334]